MGAMLCGSMTPRGSNTSAFSPQFLNSLGFGDGREFCGTVPECFRIDFDEKFGLT